MADDSLETPLDPELLRAVPLQAAMAGDGWRKSMGVAMEHGTSVIG